MLAPGNAASIASSKNVDRISFKDFLPKEEGSGNILTIKNRNQKGKNVRSKLINLLKNQKGNNTKQQQNNRLANNDLNNFSFGQYQFELPNSS